MNCRLQENSTRQSKKQYQPLLRFSSRLQLTADALGLAHSVQSLTTRENRLYPEVKRQFFAKQNGWQRCRNSAVQSLMWADLLLICTAVSVRNGKRMEHAKTNHASAAHPSRTEQKDSLSFFLKSERFQRSNMSLSAQAYVMI